MPFFEDPTGERALPGVRAFAFVAIGACLSAAGRAATGDGYTYRTRFNIDYDVTEGGTDVARVELWVTEDGGASWRREGFDDDLRPPVSFKAERDGRYGFYMVFTDRAGNRSSPRGEPREGTPPQLTVVVDTRPPKVELLAPRPDRMGRAFGRARGVRIAWRASDEYLADSPVTIDYTTDDGASWKPVAAGLAAADTYVFSPRGPIPPGVRRYRFRVTARDRAGNTASVAAVDDVLLDDEPPSVRATGPREARGAEVEVTYEARDRGASGIESVRLYVIPMAEDPDMGGRHWAEAAVDEDGESPLVWKPERPGEHGLYLVGTDRAGNVGRLPSADTEPQLVCEVIATGPVVHLHSFNTGGYYRGGVTYEIRWRAFGRGLGPAPVTLEYSLDGGATWTEIARERPASGAYTWKLPRTDTERASVRVRATGAAGTSGAAVSKRPFVIDSTAPRAVVRFDAGGQDELAPLASRRAAPLAGEEGERETAGQLSPEGPPEETPEGPAVLRARAPRKVTPEPVLRARDHLAEGSPRGVSAAKEVMEEFVSREPWNAEANVLLGEARARETEALARSGGLSPQELLRRYDEAAAALRAALRAEEELPVRLTGRGRFWLGMCHFHRARIFYQKLHSADDGVAEARLAVEEFEQTLAIPPNSADEHYNAGMAYYFLALAGPEEARVGSTDRAAELLEKALVPEVGKVSNRVSGSAHYYLADLARRANNRPKGLEHARKALEKLGEDSPYAAQIREMIRRMGGR